MKKKDLAVAISEKTGISQKEVEVVLTGLVKVVNEATEKQQKITLRGLFTYNLIKRKAKVGQVMKRTGEATQINIPERYTPVFKPSKELKEKAKLVSVG